MGELAPRKEQGRLAGRCVSFYGKVMGFSGERAGSLFRCARKREKDKWPMGLSPEDLTVGGNQEVTLQHSLLIQ